MQNLEFVLQSGRTLAEAMQGMVAQLQTVAAGRPFVIQSMMAVPEMLAPGLGDRHPRMQVTVVMAVAYNDAAVDLPAADGMPGMSLEDIERSNIGALEDFTRVRDAAKRAGLA